ncbi:hypothetical protein HN604_04045 [archaeon]|jgi:hypothetical protein|nr:hypothetical protein [archaeon]MBT6182392.1 hypothetical protein [archaeon]MBT6606396.1 hypothetical protein [archaeon]MBT7251435.1 hypothetical protein [archaeon]MBT7661220.1 hypothetical protein [archaeon]
MKRSVVLISSTIIFFLAIVISANSAPTLTQTFEEIILREGISLTINLSEYYTDPDGDNITYEITPGIGIGINLTIDELKITPDDGFFGSSNMSVKVSDSNVSKTDDVFIYVVPINPEENGNSNETNTTVENSTEENNTIVNNPPTVTINHESTILKKIGEELNLSVTATDSEGDLLSYSWFVDGVQVSGEGPKNTFNDLEIGEYTITLETTDGQETTISSWSITIEEKINKTLRWAIVILTLIGLGAIDYYLISILRKEISQKKY